MADPTTKTELLAEMQHGYTNFAALLAPLNEAQLTTTGVNGEWSIKDILVHIATWQQRTAERLEFIAHNEKIVLNPSIETEEQMHAFNAQTFAANRSLPLSQVQEHFHSSVQRLQTAVEAVDESDLFSTDRFTWLDGDPLWKNIGGNSFWHYEEHTPMITEWLAMQKV